MGRSAVALQIEQGLALGAYAFLDMYRGLYAARGRRLLRAVRRPHAAGDALFEP